LCHTPEVQEEFRSTSEMRRSLMNIRTSKNHQTLFDNLFTYVGVVFFVAVNILLVIMAAVILVKYFNIFQMLRGVP
jgi:hypothetical protein